VGLPQTFAADHLWRRGERNSIRWTDVEVRFGLDSHLLRPLISHPRVIVYAVGYSLYYGDMIIGYSDFVASSTLKGFVVCRIAFYFILTIVFVVTGLTLSSAFKRQTGRPDVVRHFLTYLRTAVKFNAGHSSNADLGHALAHHSCTLHPH
jgi:hypothetical protein